MHRRHGLFGSSAKTRTHMHIQMRWQKPRKKLVLSSVAISVIAAGISFSPLVQAQTYQEQINALNQQNTEKRGSLEALDSQATSLQDTIARQQAQIDALQAQIQINDAKRLETVAQIAKAEADLAHQKQILADDLRAMYIGGQMSSLEQLATSQSLSAFADAQQYKIAVQHKIQATLKSINDLKAKLAVEKANLEKMIIDLNNMRNAVSAQQAEQARLLSLNQQQQADLDNQIKANSGKIAELRRQQAIENARLFGNKIPAGVPGGGGYPGKWAFAPMDTIVDSWGMYNRECVSWTAYKVYASGRYMPYWGGVGNANQWDDNARRAGIPVDTHPRDGDVAVSNSGTWGHVMYVESTAADGSIYVSDYNQQYDGLYREYWVSAATVSARGLVFIHF